MTRDEIKTLALECGFSDGPSDTSSGKIFKTYNGQWVNVTENLYRFAEKVAAAERASLQAAQSCALLPRLGGV